MLKEIREARDMRECNINKLMFALECDSEAVMEAMKFYEASSQRLYEWATSGQLKKDRDGLLRRVQPLPAKPINRIPISKRIGDDKSFLNLNLKPKQ